MARWSTPGVPHKGWSCIGIEDLGKGEYQSCMMCGNDRVRYVHYMSHQEYSETLSVGCTFSGNMSDDYAAAKERETAFKKSASRKTRWLTKKWRLSAKGNEYLNVADHNIGVFAKGDKWNGWLNGKYSQRNFDTKDEAKKYLIDHLDKLMAIRD